MRRMNCQTDTMHCVNLVWKKRVCKLNISLLILKLLVEEWKTMETVDLMNLMSLLVLVLSNSVHILIIMGPQVIASNMMMQIITSCIYV